MKTLLWIFIIILTIFSISFTQSIDVSRAAIIMSPAIKSPVQNTIVRVLKEEGERRSAIDWQRAESWSEDQAAVFAIALSSDKKLAGHVIPHKNGENRAELKPEGYRVFTETWDNRKIVWIIGADARATLFGAGYLLRHIHFREDGAFIKNHLDIATSPDHSIRGHQLGYRNTANSYDAWNVDQYEQYIRELVLFGTNAVENIPFGEHNNSVHMPIPRAEMNIRMSEICAAYDIDYWVWTPATFDLTDVEKRTAMLDRHERFYKSCPRLDQIFFPGGDPGHNHPKHVMPFLKELTERLVQYHPQAGMWISLQGFSAEQVDYFYTYIEEEKPEWLRGVVSGPSSPPTADTRFRLPEQYKHRLYPDITHNVRCEYPVQNWDQAYMLTIGREGINPRPNAYAKIHAAYAPFTDGFVTYSDGCHDDVNKIIWSMRGWDLDDTVRDILIEYCRFFFGSDLAEKAADGILALERNWAGSIITNGAIETTLNFWQTMETSNPHLSDSWRWQMLLLRAHYDAYQRQRKIYQVDLEKKANDILAQAAALGAEAAMREVLILVNKADKAPVAQNIRTRIAEYCENLFHSIGLQTSVPKYQASNAQRGCILDFVDYPLNNRWWLEDEFTKIRQMESEQEKLARLKVIHAWEQPGTGSYYDNVSDIEHSPRVLTTSYDATDVAWWEGGYSRARLSSQLFQNELELQYKNLDFNGRYLLRLCGKGDALVRVDGEQLEPLLYNTGFAEFKEYVLPKWITRDGHMRVRIDRPEESFLNWRNYSHVSDVWLIKQGSTFNKK